MTGIDKAVIAAVKKNFNHLVPDFDCHYIEVKHQDGSQYKITHAKIERVMVKHGKGNLDCIIVYPEHNTVCLFVEADLVSVKVKPWEGKKYELKIKNEL